MPLPFRSLTACAVLLLLAALPAGAADLGFVRGLGDFQYGQDTKIEHTALQFVTAHAKDPAALREFAAAVRAAGAKAKTADGRALAAQLLGLVGGPADVPFLAGLLSSPTDFPAGVSALSRIADESAVDALAAAYATAGDDTRRLALIKGLGWSYSPRAAGVLASIAENSSPALAAAAFEALASSSSSDAYRALAAAKRPEAVPALLAAARTLARQGAREPSGRILARVLASPGLTDGQRVTAERIQLDHDLPGAEQLLQGDGVIARELELDYFPRLPAARKAALVGELLASPSAPETKVKLARLQEMLPAETLIPFLSVGDVEARQIAQFQIARRPDRPSYEHTVREYLGASSAEASAPWLGMLVAMPRTADAWLVETLAATTSAGDRVRLNQLVKRRVAVAAIPAMLASARDADPKVKLSAYEALGAIGTGDTASALELLTEAKTSVERRESSNALRVTFRRAPDRASAVAAAVARLDASEDAPTRDALLGFLGETGEAAALTTLWKRYDQGDAVVRANILRALARWPDLAPLDRLARAAASEQTPNLRILALRDYLDVLGRASSLAPKESLSLLEKVSSLAERDEERLAVLAAAVNVRDAGADRIFDALASYPSISTEVAAARKSHAEALKGPVKKAAKSAAVAEPEEET